MWKLSHVFEVALFVFIVIIQVNSGCTKPNNPEGFFLYGNYRTRSKLPYL